MPVLRIRMLVFTKLFVPQTDASFLSQDSDGTRQTVAFASRTLLSPAEKNLPPFINLSVWPWCLDRMVKFRYYLEYSEILLTLYLDDRALFLFIVPIPVSLAKLIVG